jgi:hypothetical protein
MADAFSRTKERQRVKKRAQDVSNNSFGLFAYNMYMLVLERCFRGSVHVLNRALKTLFV